MAYPTDLTNVDSLNAARTGTGSFANVAVDSNAQATAIKALAAKVGVDDSAVTTSLDYRVNALEDASVDHGALTGLTDDDHSQYALLAGRATGQTVKGGTAASETLTLSSTNHATKGNILFGTSAYDEVNNRLGIGTTAPVAGLEVESTGTATVVIHRNSGVADGTSIGGFTFRLLGTSVASVIAEAEGSAEDAAHLRFLTATGGTLTEQWRISNLGKLSNTGVIGTAYIHLKAGTATAATAPLKFTAGTNLTTPEAGVMEFSNSGTGLTFTAVSTRRAVVLDTATQTLTNKRVTPRTGTTTSSATPTINTDNVDFYSLTAQAVDITSFTTNLSGTPTEGQKLWIAITGTASRAITWGASFEASTVALPTTTSSTARLDVEFVWNTVTSKWRVITVA